MFCPSCGAVVKNRMKFCVQCGVNLARPKDDETIDSREERLAEYLEGIFWVAVFGLGLIVGGMVVLNQVLHPGRGVLIAYMAISSITFLIVFCLHLWQILRIAGARKGAESPDSQLLQEETAQESIDTNRIIAAEKEQELLQPPSSVAEDVTRSFESINKESVAK